MNQLCALILNNNLHPFKWNSVSIVPTAIHLPNNAGLSLHCCSVLDVLADAIDVMVQVSRSSDYELDTAHVRVVCMW